MRSPVVQAVDDFSGFLDIRKKYGTLHVFVGNGLDDSFLGQWRKTMRPLVHIVHGKNPLINELTN